MMQDQLEKAAHSNESDRAKIISEIVNQPDALQGSLYVFTRPLKHLWGVAVQVIRAIGYPKNASAIPSLVNFAGNMNAPGWEAAVETLDELGAPFVVPYLLAYLWDKERHQYWGYDVEGICLMLSSVNREFAVMCGPTIAYLLSQEASTDPHDLDKGFLLDVLEKIGADCGEYALPTLISLLQREETYDLRTRIHRLIASFDKELLEPYRLVLDAVKN